MLLNKECYIEFDETDQGINKNENKILKNEIQIYENESE